MFKNLNFEKPFLGKKAFYRFKNFLGPIKGLQMINYGAKLHQILAYWLGNVNLSRKKWMGDFVLGAIQTKSVQLADIAANWIYRIKPIPICDGFQFFLHLV